MGSKDIYSLGLGESTNVGTWRVTRVPGGWIFGTPYDDAVAVFVPYHDEFNKTGRR